jgi:hypothetical protein
MGTLANSKLYCKWVPRPSPQAGVAAGHNDQATAFLTGSPTWDLDAWPLLPHVMPAFGSHCRQNYHSRLDCRHTTAVSDILQDAGGHEKRRYGPRDGILSPCPRDSDTPGHIEPGLIRTMLPAHSPGVPHPCGKDVRTRSDCGGGFCPRAVYLYPQITVSGWPENQVVTLILGFPVGCTDLFARAGGCL